MRIAILFVCLAACTTTGSQCDQGADLPPCTDCSQGAVRLGRFFCDGARSWMTPGGKLAHDSGGTLEILDDRMDGSRGVAVGQFVHDAAFDVDGTTAVLINPQTSTVMAAMLVDSSGKIVWNSQAGDDGLSGGSIALGPSRVFATTSTTTITTTGSTTVTTLSAFDRSTGALVWSRSDLVTAVVVADPAGGAIVAGSTLPNSGFVMAVDDAGQPRWTTPLSATGVSHLTRGPDGRLAVAASAWVGMLDGSGTLLWSATEATPNSIAIVGDQLAVGAGTGLDLVSPAGTTTIARATGVGLHDILALGSPDPTSLLVSIGSFSDPEDYDHNALDSQPPPPTLVFDGVEIDGTGVALARLAL